MTCVCVCVCVCVCRPNVNEGQTLVARALYDFSSGNSDELTVSAGDELVRNEF